MAQGRPLDRRFKAGLLAVIPISALPQASDAQTPRITPLNIAESVNSCITGVFAKDGSDVGRTVRIVSRCNDVTVLACAFDGRPQFGRWRCGTKRLVGAGSAWHQPAPPSLGTHFYVATCSSSNFSCSAGQRWLRAALDGRTDRTLDATSLRQPALPPPLPRCNSASYPCPAPMRAGERG